MDAPLPANTLTFLKGIYSIASFDFYPNLNDNINELLNLLPTKPMTEGLADLGFDTNFILNNLGTMVIFFLGNIVLVLVQKVLERC